MYRTSTTAATGERSRHRRPTRRWPTVFDQVDFVICATNPDVAFPADIDAEHPGRRPARSGPSNNGALTIPANICGNPAISVPVEHVRRPAGRACRSSAATTRTPCCSTWPGSSSASARGRWWRRRSPALAGDRRHGTAHRRSGVLVTPPRHNGSMAEQLPPPHRDREHDGPEPTEWRLDERTRAVPASQGHRARLGPGPPRPRPATATTTRTRPTPRRLDRPVKRRPRLAP